jgi:hypothetical protein
VGEWVGGWVGAAGPQSILTCWRNVENHRHGAAAKKYNKLNNIHSSKTNYTIHFLEERGEREGFGWGANMVGCSSEGLIVQAQNRISMQPMRSRVMEEPI